VYFKNTFKNTSEEQHTKI